MSHDDPMHPSDANRKLTRKERRAARRAARADAKRQRQHRAGRAKLKPETLEPRILLSATWVDADTDLEIPQSTDGNDIYTGDALANLADGQGGDDQMFGGLGDDTLTGDTGERTLVQRSNSFDDAGNGWTGSFNQDAGLGTDYGWQNTGVAGGTGPGEAGGDFTRGDTVSYYADPDIGTLTLDEDLAFTTRLTVEGATNPDNGVLLGWFDDADNGLLVEIKEPQGSGFRVVIVAMNEGVSTTSSVLTVDEDVDYDLGLSYDANTGMAALSIHRVDNGASVGTQTLNVAAQGISGEAFDKFGLRTYEMTSPNTNQVIDLHIDDISYTAAEGNANGTHDDDLLYGGGGDDTLAGGLGDDTLDGGGQSYDVGALNSGVAVADDRTGTGYLMYSVEHVDTRFSDQPPYPSNADHFVAVVYDAATDKWYYDDNGGGPGNRPAEEALFEFVPRDTDILVAALDFDADTATDLKGTASYVQGIFAGYRDGDLTITPNQWGGASNAGEFGLTGTTITPWLTGDGSLTDADTLTGGSGDDTLIGDDLSVAEMLALDPDLQYNASTGKFYKLVPGGSVSWDDANTMAEGMSVGGLQGRLVTIKSADENTFVQNVASGNFIWLGANDTGQQDAWVWADGTNLEYENFATNEPNGVQFEDAIRMADNGQWADASHLNNSYRVVVEFDPGSSFDDQLTGGEGNDELQGGLGEDTAHYAGNAADYTITHNPDGTVTVIDNLGSEGTDTLTDVERILFADQVYETDKQAFNAAPTDITLEAPGDDLVAQPITTIDSYNSSGNIWSDTVPLPDGGYMLLYTDYDLNQGWDIVGQKYTADGDAVGEASVITSNMLSGNQYDQSVTQLDDGTNVVIWLDSGIFIQRFDEDFEPLGSRIRVETTTQFYETHPAITSLSDGGFVATWINQVDQNSDGRGDYYDIYAQKFDASGSKVGDELKVSETLGHQYQPSVASFDNGGFMVTWRDDTTAIDGSSDGVGGRIYDGNGDPIGAEFAVNTTTSGYQGDPDAVALDGDKVLVVYRNGDGSGQGVYGKVFDSAGNVLTDEYPINVGFTTGDQFDIKTESLEDGGAAIVWRSRDETGIHASNGRIMAARVDLNGDLVGTPWEISDTDAGFQQRLPNVGQLEDGNLVFSWLKTSAGTEETQTNDKVWRVHTDLDGNHLTGVLETETFGQVGDLRVETSALSTGGHVVTWRNTGIDGSGWGIRGQVYDAAGNEQGDPFILNVDRTSGDQHHPTIAALPNGGFVAAWQSTGDGSSWGIRVARFDGDGNQVPGSEIWANTSTALQQELANVAVDPDGGYAVTWRTLDHVSASSNWDSMMQRFDADGSKVGGEILLNETIAGDQREPRIAFNSDGVSLVTWMDSDNSEGNGDGSGWSVKARLFAEDGSSIGGEFIVNDYTSSTQAEPQVAALLDGRFAVSYYSYGEDGSRNSAVARIVNPDGTFDSDGIVLSQTTASNQSHIQITDTRNGGFAVSWRGAGEGQSSALWGRTFDANGTPTSDEFKVSDVDEGWVAWRTSLIERNDGSLVFNWTSFDKNEGSVLQQRIFTPGLIESTVGGAIVAKLTATDADDTEGFTYEIIVDDNGDFEIVDGHLVVKQGSTFDAENDPVRNLTIRVTDSAGNTFDKAFGIEPLPVNEAPTSISFAAPTLPENSPNGTVVATATAADPDAGDTITYSLNDDAGGRFTIDPSTGQVTVADSTLLNYEDAASHDVVIRATDSAGLRTERTFTIQLADVNDAPDGVALTTNTIDENAANNTAVGTVTPSDEDTGDTHTFALVDNPLATLVSAEKLTFTDAEGYGVGDEIGGQQDSDTGAEWISQSQNRAGYDLFQVADEGDGNRSIQSQPWDSNFEDYNWARYFPAGENGLADGAQQLLSFDLRVDGPAASNDSTGWRIELGRDRLTDLSGGRTINLEVMGDGELRLHSGDGTTSLGTPGFGDWMQIAVLLDYDAKTADLYLDGIKVAGGIAFQDPATANGFQQVNFGTTQEVNYTQISVRDLAVEAYEGADADGRFAIDSSTGEVTVADGTKLDAETDTTHDIVVRVTDDSGATYDQTLRITVNDLDDNAISATTDTDTVANAVAENASNGTVVGVTALATDADAGATVTYALADDANGRFTIDPTTGVVTVADATQLDHEQSNTHTVTVQATSSDGDTTSEDFTIEVTDVNDGPTLTIATGSNLVINGDKPGIAGWQHSGNVSTNGSGQFSAGNTANNGQLWQSVTTVPGQTYVLQFDMRQINAPQLQTLGVHVTGSTSLIDTSYQDNGDGGTKRHTLTFTADSASTELRFLDESTVTNSVDLVLDNVSLHVAGTPTVAEDASNGTQVATALPNDPDAGDTHTFTLTDDADGRFAIDANGVITVADASKLDHETDASHDLTVRVADAAGETYDETFTIAVSDVNEAPTDLDIEDGIAFDGSTLIRIDDDGSHALSSDASISAKVQADDFAGSPFLVTRFTAGGDEAFKVGFSSDG
ncbi:MAG: cadherin domain-containing protein, partial [Planctomycetota bacterium]